MNMPRRIYLMVLVLIATSLVGCGGHSEESFDVLVLDGANTLSKETKDWLRAYKYPKGFALVVRTETLIPTSVVGAVADDLFKSTGDQHSAKDAFEKRGVFLLASRTPALIQIRVGSDIYSLARWGGVTAGSRYVEQQTAVRQRDVNLGIRQMVAWAASELPAVTDIPWYKRFLLQDIVQSLSTELDDLSLPSEGLYGALLLKPISTIRIVENTRFGSWWMTYLLMGGVYYLLKKLIDFLLVGPLRRWPSKVGNAFGFVVAVVVGIALAVPSAASAILLSGSRLEDQLALQASGLPGVDKLAFQPDMFSRSTGVWIALLFVLLRVLKGFAYRGGIAGLAGLSEAQQHEIFMRVKERDPLWAMFLEATGMRTGKTIEISEEEYVTSPFTYSYMMPVVDDLVAGIKWGLLAYLFLPLGLSLATVYFWVVPIGTGIIATAQSVLRSKVVA